MSVNVNYGGETIAQLSTGQKATLSCEGKQMEDDVEVIYEGEEIVATSGVQTINGKTLQFFVGTKSEYGRLTTAEKEELLAVITDDESKEQLQGLLDGTISASKALNDAEGRAIHTSYVKKSEFENGYYAPQEVKLSSGKGTISLAVGIYAIRESSMNTTFVLAINGSKSYNYSSLGGYNNDSYLIEYYNGEVTLKTKSASESGFSTFVNGNGTLTITRIA